MTLNTLKEEIETFWDNVTEGWRHLWKSAAGALTRFKPGEDTALPPQEEVDDRFYLPTRGWAMLGGDVFEDDTRLVVRLEVPGLKKEEIDIEVTDGALHVSGEKRFARESTEGRWRVMQCAYGSFCRSVPLPVTVKPEAARASYENGILRIELPKAVPGAPKAVRVPVA